MSYKWQQITYDNGYGFLFEKTLDRASQNTLLKRSHTEIMQKFQLFYGESCSESYSERIILIINRTPNNFFHFKQWLIRDHSVDSRREFHDKPYLQISAENKIKISDDSF